MKRLLVTGASGMLGRDVATVFDKLGYEVFALSHKELDITRPQSIEHAFGEFQPDVIVNCAAFTRVDECEANQQAAFNVNARGPALLASACRKESIYLVHVSTDYVFDGQSNIPYKEIDLPNPINVYGQSKLEGEIRIRQILKDYLIVRTSWLFGPSGPNFITTILRLADEQQKLRIVDDQRGSPTYTRDLARAIAELVENQVTGLCHCVNTRACTWFELADFVLANMGIKDTHLIPVPTKDFPRPAKRPLFSVLDTGLFQQLTGHGLRPWQEAVSEYLKEFGRDKPLKIAP